MTVHLRTPSDRRESVRLELARLRFENTQLRELNELLDRANNLLIAGHAANVKFLSELIEKEPKK